MIDFSPRRYVDRTMLVDLLMVADIVLIALIGLITFGFRHDHLELNSVQVFFLIFAPVMARYLLGRSGAYNVNRAFHIHYGIRTVTIGGWMTIFVLALVGFLFKSAHEISRVWFVTWAFSAWGGLIAVRVVMRLMIDRLRFSSMLRRQAVLVGTKQFIDRLRERISDAHEGLIALPLIVDIREGEHELEDLTKGMTEIEALCRVQLPDDFIIAIPGHRTDLIERTIALLRSYSANIGICAEQGFIRFPIRDSRLFAGVPVLEVVNRPLDGWGGVVKWFEDKILGALILLLVLPAMLVIAIAIKLDSKGPVLFRQKRFGFGNQEITVFKFRTMVDETEDEVVPQAKRDDPRVTRVGSFLRRKSLDELPQLFNVLRGEMSLVGPRPHAVAHNRYYGQLIDEYLSRHRLKPGITGWAQVNGLRGETRSIEDMRRRLEYDIHYIENWSLWLDMIILVRTIPVVFNDRNAY